MAKLSFMRALQLLFIFCLPVYLSAQQALADSIQKRLQLSLPDSTRAMDMIYYAMYTEPLNMDSAHRLYRQAVDFSVSRKLWYHAGVALRYEATPFYLQGQRQQELDNIKTAEKYFLQSTHYNAKRELAATYGNLSGYYRAIEKFDSAIYYSMSAIRIQEENSYHNKLLISYINTAMIYQQIKLKEKQKEYLDKALGLAKQLNESSGLFLAYMQASHYYTEVKRYIDAKNYIDSARNYFNDRFDFSRKQTYYLLSAVSFYNLNIYDSAVYFYQQAYELAKQNNSRWNMIEPLLQAGNIKAKQKDFINAEKYINEGIEYAELDSANTFIKDGYKYLSELFASTGRYKEALEAYKKFTAARDTLLNEENRKYILELEEKYEVEKKDNLLKLQQAAISQQKIQQYLLIAGMGILTVILFFLYRNHKQRQKIQQHRISELETEKQLMATEAVLKGEEQERTRLAKDLHDGLGGMLSGIKYSFNTMKGNLVMTPENAQAFERSMDMLDSSIKEMRRVAHNMMPEVLLRYGLDAALKDHTTEINKSGIIKIVNQSIGAGERKLDQTTSFALYRIVQELISNTIRHSGATGVLLQTFWEPGKLIINVEDNGTGFDTAILENAEGIGWKNIRSRVDFLKGTIDVQSTPGKGTFVNIEYIFS